MQLATTPAFDPGQIVMTAGVNAWLTDDNDNQVNRVAFVAGSLRRHLIGDWGDLDADDRRANDRALTGGSRILSAYRFPDQITPPQPTYQASKIWIITEADRSATTILFPSEY